MRIKKPLCALLCCAALWSAAGCGQTPAPQPETPQPPMQTQTFAEETAQAATTEPDAGTTRVHADEAADETTGETQTEPDETTQPAADEVRLQDGLNSTDVAQVLAFYKLAAAENDTPKYKKTLELISINGGEGKVAEYVDIFEPIAKKAIAKNSTTGDPLPGDYRAIRPEDWQSAEAVSDGRYTTIRVRVAPQTDGPNGSANEGSVGRSMTVLPGVQAAVDEMPGVSADFENGDMQIEYQQPTITVKVDNRTGAFVPGACSWTYRVHPTLRYLVAKVLVWTVHLINADGYVDYTISY